MEAQSNSLSRKALAAVPPSRKALAAVPPSRKALAAVLPSRKALAAVPPSRKALAAVLEAPIARPAHNYPTDSRIPTTQEVLKRRVLAKALVSCFTRMRFGRLPCGQLGEPGLAPFGSVCLTTFAALIVYIMLSLSAHAQLPPSIGYMFPPGGQAGQTIEVSLGGYDWTPDMQLFVRDERMRLKIIGEPGPVIVPKPPYWFGKKARRAPYKLARETKARLSIPADVPPGVYQWQAANANGATACGRFVVTAAPIQLESTETTNVIQSLPVCLCGQIKLISEVDRYQFVAQSDGRIECSLVAASIASPLRAIVEVRDAAGKLVAEAADTAGGDLKLSFAARAGKSYTAAVYDLDFCGDASFVYQLCIVPEKAAAVPTVATQSDAMRTLSLPTVVSGALQQKHGEDRYRLSGQVGDVWAISVSGEKTGSQVDPAVTVFDASGKELARADDSSGSTDAQLEFKLPVAGEYEIVVSDLSGSSGSPSATYELSIQRSVPDFQLQTVELLAVPIGGKATIELKANRRGGFTDPIDVKFVGLPTGMSVAENLRLPAKQNSLKVEVKVDPAAAATAAMVSVQGQAVINEQTTERSTDPILMCTTIKPPFEIDAEGKDDVTKWPRGTTYPAPVLIARDPGFKGDIVLEMTSLQGRHVQGIAGPELRVGPNESRVLYPVFLPEWLETTRTSRMVVNGVAQVADPQGNVRYSLSRQKTRMGFLPTGALLKISTEAEIAFQPEKRLVIPVLIHRDLSLNQSLKLTLVSDALESTPFSAEAQEVAPNVSRCEFAIDVNKALISKKEYPLTIRATVMKDGVYPVVSETKVIVSQGLQETSQ